ncbi:HMG (high mobility group) box protein [Ceratobasidium sp. AG-Ba]|nr:HMG (high mobility group) box protein [Ceratobasidium sp. AG-Ba]
MAQHLRAKPPPMDNVSHIANQISSMPVAPAAEPQKREIVGKLNELAAQMKHWAAQVEGFASLLNSFSILPGHAQTQPPPQQKPSSYNASPESSENAHYAPRGAPNGHTYSPYPSPSQQQTQQYAGAQHYQFHVQQYQGHPNGASPPSYPLSAAGQSQPEGSPATLTTVLDTNEKPGKRRRKEGTRRKKDPLAPKRPPSAYILYQNDVRKEMQDKYPELTYPEVLGKISGTWQTLDEDKKKVYLDLVERDKVRYEDEKLRYNMGQDVPTRPTPRRPLSSLRAPSEPEIDPEPEGDDVEEEVDGADQDDQEPDPKRTRLGSLGDSPSHRSSLVHKDRSRSDSAQPTAPTTERPESPPQRQPSPHSLSYPPQPSPPREPHSPQSTRGTVRRTTPKLSPQI